jgi:putative transposase
MLAGRGIAGRTSQRGDGHDNGAMETFFSTVKRELGERFEAYRIENELLFEDTELFYNQQRHRSALGQISPAAFERQAAARPAA